MTIYASSRAMPYVYKLVHRKTGQFYFGSRYSKELKWPSNIDLPKYKTSSKFVKELGFENFDWFIVAEFFDGDDAWDYEQELISEHFNDPLCLNKHHRQGQGAFNRSGPMPKSAVEKMSLSHRGKVLTEEHKANIAAGHIGKTRPEFSDEWKANLSKANKGKPKPKPADFKDRVSEDWLVTYPDGKTETIRNMMEFCRRNNLNHSHMSAVAKGKRNIHKGFRCSKLTAC